MEQDTHSIKAPSWRTPERRAYDQAKGRCRNPNDLNYSRYGGRGIEFRFNSFLEFLNHIGLRPSSDHSLNRADNNGHYEKGNVEWTTRKKQSRNRRNNVMITALGTTRCVAEWAEVLGLRHDLIFRRLRRGWCGQCAVLNSQRMTCLHKKSTMDDKLAD